MNRNHLVSTFINWIFEHKNPFNKRFQPDAQRVMKLLQINKRSQKYDNKSIIIEKNDLYMKRQR